MGSKNSKYNNIARQPVCGCDSACDCIVRDNFHRAIQNNTTNSFDTNETPPPYDKLQATPLTSDILRKERMAFINKRAQFYEKLYTDSCEKIINYINKKMLLNLSKKV